MARTSRAATASSPAIVNGKVLDARPLEGAHDATRWPSARRSAAWSGLRMSPRTRSPRAASSAVRRRATFPRVRLRSRCPSTQASPRAGSAWVATVRRPNRRHQGVFDCAEITVVAVARVHGSPRPAPARRAPAPHAAAARAEPGCRSYDVAEALDGATSRRRARLGRRGGARTHYRGATHRAYQHDVFVSGAASELDIHQVAQPSGRSTRPMDPRRAD